MPENVRLNVFTLLLPLLLLLLRTNVGSSSSRRQNSGAPGLKTADETMKKLQSDMLISKSVFGKGYLPSGITLISGLRKIS